MNGDNPSVEFEDGTQKGGHRGCVGCDGEMHSSFDSEYMSHQKYKTLEEKQNLVLTGPDGKKCGLYPFKNLKIEQSRGELRGRGEDKIAQSNSCNRSSQNCLGVHAEFLLCCMVRASLV